MRRSAALLLLALAACGGPPPVDGEGLEIEVRAGATEVPPGRGFPLTVRRAWPRALEVADLDDGALAPLVVRLESSSRREDGRRVEEVRRYRAYAFALDDVVVPPVRLAARPRGGGPVATVESAPTRVHVVPVLDAEAPGPPERPDALLAEPTPDPRWAALAALLVAALAGAMLVRRRGRVAPTPSAPAGPPAPDALARLRALRGVPADDAVARRRAVWLAVDAVRDHVRERTGVPARRRTSTDLLRALAAAAALDPHATRVLAGILARGDAVKFAAHVPDAAALAALLDDAERFVATTDGRPT